MARIRLAVWLTALAATLSAAAPAVAGGGDKLRIEILSNRADLISDGNALVAIQLPPRVGHATVRLNGRLVSDAFAKRPDGRYEALLQGLRIGRNRLEATAGRWTAKTIIINHENGGPVTSGPQNKPWVCQSTARDSKCNQPPTYDFHYKPATGGDFQPYDPAHPPAAGTIAMTTTDRGKTMPFIVRREVGYQNRDQYASAVLFDPAERGKPSLPWNPPKGFNGTLLISHGAGCGLEYKTGAAPDILNANPQVLGRGMAVLSTALDNAGHNCSIATQAESLIMAKERLIEAYGPLRYTIGEGSSGGSLASQQVANAYPGIYQGLAVDNSFPDAGSNGIHLFDSHAVNNYLLNPQQWEPGVVWDPAAMNAVLGTPVAGGSFFFDLAFWGAVADPTRVCPGMTEKQAYNPSTNPRGTRCTLMDYQVNVLGPRRKADWSAVERKIGKGFAGVPYGNVGVPYGLNALKDGQITAAQFTDLNAKVGGVDHDYQRTSQRLHADRDALTNAYRTGFINMTNNLTGTPIIDLRQQDGGGIHDAYRAFATRARMAREQGRDPRNHVIVGAHNDPTLPGTPPRRLAIEWLVEWLNAVEADRRAVSLEQKVAEDRPARVHDMCTQWDLEGTGAPGVSDVCNSTLFRTSFDTPRGAAGGPYSNDVAQCRLKPLRKGDFQPVQFSEAQWRTLERTFPTGICDWTKPADRQAETIPWLSYQNGDGKVVYGGKTLGPAPAGSGTGWTAPSFDSWRAATIGGRFRSGAR